MSSFKDQIRAAIERYKQGAAIARFDNAGENADYFQGKVDLCDDLLGILDTLPEQPVEGLEEAAEEYLQQVKATFLRTLNHPTAKECFIAGAEWGISQGKEVKDAALKLCETVERYTNGAALRSELLNTVTQTRLKMR